MSCEVITIESKHYLVSTGTHFVDGFGENWRRVIHVGDANLYVGGVGESLGGPFV